MFGRKKNVCDCTPQCRGINMFALGILVILNAKYSWLDWATFIGAVIAAKGLLVFAMKGCMCRK